MTGSSSSLSDSYPFDPNAKKESLFLGVDFGGSAGAGAGEGLLLCVVFFALFGLGLFCNEEIIEKSMPN
jgi:hypothetical protein